MPTREKGFAICVENRGAEDLEIRKVYRVLHDKGAAATGYMRVIDESGEDYIYPAHYFVSVELPHKAKRAWTANRSLVEDGNDPGKISYALISSAPGAQYKMAGTLCETSGRVYSFSPEAAYVESTRCSTQGMQPRHRL